MWNGMVRRGGKVGMRMIGKKEKLPPKKVGC
jgi:hypothetical protein